MATGQKTLIREVGQASTTSEVLLCWYFGRRWLDPKLKDDHSRRARKHSSLHVRSYIHVFAWEITLRKSRCSYNRLIWRLPHSRYISACTGRRHPPKRGRHQPDDETETPAHIMRGSAFCRLFLALLSQFWRYFQWSTIIQTAGAPVCFGVTRG